MNRSALAIEKLCDLVAAALLLLILLVMVADVFGRYVLNRPVTGASEIVEVLMMAMIFVVLPSLALRGEHITADVLDGRAAALFDVLQRGATALVGAASFGIAAGQLLVLANGVRTYGEVTASLRLPIAPLIYFMALLALATAAAFLGSMFVRAAARTAQ